MPTGTFGGRRGLRRRQPGRPSSAVETWYDGIDQDCDGASDWDADGDGFDADWHPDGTGDSTTATPTCIRMRRNAGIGTDDDCDGNFSDADGDGQDNRVGGRCDDGNPTVYLDAPETWYDGIDQDCYPWTSTTRTSTLRQRRSPGADWTREPVRQPRQPELRWSGCGLQRRRR